MEPESKPRRRRVWRRVILGFLLATVVGVPLGILCGCFAPVQAFFLPLTVFGRNIPLAALIPLTFFVFGIGEIQKVLFIFIACVMFITWDTATSIRDVSQRYVDTAYTLGASRYQVIVKVLTPRGHTGYQPRHTKRKCRTPLMILRSGKSFT